MHICYDQMITLHCDEVKKKKKKKNMWGEFCRLEEL